ncbi:MAG: hypothetical protein ACYDA5_00820 [Vulcanimicrobiaceae bacterium]
MHYKVEFTDGASLTVDESEGRRIMQDETGRFIEVKTSDGRSIWINTRQIVRIMEHH